jgi:hypothetical protein
MSKEDTRKVIIRVPRRDAELIADILEMNNMPCLVQPSPQYEDPLDNGPRVIHVLISVEDIMEVDDEETACEDEFKN